MAGPSLACVEAFPARGNEGFELIVEPPTARVTVEDALKDYFDKEIEEVEGAPKGYVDEGSAVMGDIRVEGLTDVQLSSALGGVASVWLHEAVTPVISIHADPTLLS